MPYNAEIDTLLSDEQRAEIQTVILEFDTDKGITYAKKWATSKNTSQYKFFSGGDCANFASQILENGGVSQDSSTSEYSGWWHKAEKGTLSTKHTHSVSWINADTFARYMGVGYTTTSNADFSANIQAGDFIACDFKSDGS